MSDLREARGADRLQVAYVGSAVPEAMGRGTRAFSTAGNKFQTNLLRHLEAEGEARTDVFSMRPAMAFPGERRLAFGGGAVPLDGGAPHARLVPYLNLRVAKELSLASSFLRHLAGWAAATRGAPRVAMVYNVFSPLALPVLAVARACRLPAVAMVADLPHDVYSFRGMKGVLERIDFRVQLAALARFDGLVTVTRQIVDDFAPGVPSLLVEGGVNPVELSPSPVANEAGDPADAHRVVLYSGALDPINGIDVLLDAFHALPEPDWRLWIFGGGPLEGRVREAADRDPRIHYHGRVSNAQVLRAQRTATVLVNPRPVEQAITRYTFPSKLFEYLLSGTAVVSTRLPGISAEYLPHLEMVDGAGAAPLARAIEAAAARPPEARAARGRAAREFVLREKSWPRQGARLGHFLREVVARSAAGR